MFHQFSVGPETETWSSSGVAFYDPCTWTSSWTGGCRVTAWLSAFVAAKKSPSPGHNNWDVLSQSIKKISDALLLAQHNRRRKIKFLQFLRKWQSQKDAMVLPTYQWQIDGRCTKSVSSTIPIHTALRTYWYRLPRPMVIQWMIHAISQLWSVVVKLMDYLSNVYNNNTIIITYYPMGYLEFRLSPHIEVLK